MLRHVLVSAALAAVHAHTDPVTTQAPTPVPNGNGYAQLGVYIGDRFDWQTDVVEELEAAITAGYNVLYIGFYRYMNNLIDPASRCLGACEDWTKLIDWEKEEVLEFAHAAGAKIVLSIGGPLEFFEGIIRDGNADGYATEGATYARNYNFDGVDIYTQLEGTPTQPSEWINNGSYINCIKDMSSAVQSLYPRSNAANWVSLTTPAPYLSQYLVQNSAHTADYALSWIGLQVNTGYSWFIPQINAIMAGEGQNYMTYDNCFTQNTYKNTDEPYPTYGSGSAVQQINGYGVPLNNIAIVKPVMQYKENECPEYYQGYVPVNDGTSDDLMTWGCEAMNTFGWQGGWVAYKWTDTDNSQVKTWVTNFNGDNNPNHVICV